MPLRLTIAARTRLFVRDVQFRGQEPPQINDALRFEDHILRTKPKASRVAPPARFMALRKVLFRFEGGLGSRDNGSGVGALGAHVRKQYRDEARAPRAPLYRFEINEDQRRHFSIAFSAALILGQRKAAGGTLPPRRRSWIGNIERPSPSRITPSLILRGHRCFCGFRCFQRPRCGYCARTWHWRGRYVNGYISVGRLSHAALGVRVARSL